VHGKVPSRLEDKKAAGLKSAVIILYAYGFAHFQGGLQNPVSMPAGKANTARISTVNRRARRDDGRQDPRDAIDTLFYNTVLNMLLL